MRRFPLQSTLPEDNECRHAMHRLVRMRIRIIQSGRYEYSTSVLKQWRFFFLFRFALEVSNALPGDGGDHCSMGWNRWRNLLL